MKTFVIWSFGIAKHNRYSSYNAEVYRGILQDRFGAGTPGEFCSGIKPSVSVSIKEGFGLVCPAVPCCISLSVPLSTGFVDGKEGFCLLPHAAIFEEFNTIKCGNC